MRSLRADSAIQRLVIAPEVKRTRYLTLAALGVAVAAILGLGALALLGGGNQVQDAVAKAEPSTVLVVRPAALTPTSRPCRSTSGPPELPGLIAASVWMTFG